MFKAVEIWVKSEKKHDTTCSDWVRQGQTGKEACSRTWRDLDDALLSVAPDRPGLKFL